MRLVHWLFLLSVAFFVSGIGFVIASGRTAQQLPDEPLSKPTAELRPVASMKQLMNGIVTPAALVVFGSVGTIISRSGTEERQPRTDEEWTNVGNSAAALVESANLLMLDGRALDDGEWMKISRALMDAATAALKATEAKAPQALFDSGSEIYAACETCHDRYQR